MAKNKNSFSVAAGLFDKDEDTSSQISQNINEQDLNTCW